MGGFVKGSTHDSVAEAVGNESDGRQEVGIKTVHGKTGSYRSFREFVGESRMAQNP